MKRNFAVVIDMFERVVLLRAAVSRLTVPGLLADVGSLRRALDALVSAAMFRPDQLSDYHLAFRSAKEQLGAVQQSNASSRGVASYQTRLFTTLRGLAVTEDVPTQMAACAAVPWVFDCFVRAMDAEAPTSTGTGATGAVGTKRLSAKAGFECFAECHGIISSLLADSVPCLLRAAALRASGALLATLDASGLYRQAVDENVSHSRSVAQSSLKSIGAALLKHSPSPPGGTTNEPAAWDAKCAAVACMTTLIKIDHQTVDGELSSVWALLEHTRGGMGRMGLHQNDQGCAESAQLSTHEQAVTGCRSACTELVRQVFFTFQQLFQVIPLVKSLLQAVREGMVGDQTISVFDVCAALRTTIPLLPSSQLPQLCAECRTELLQVLQAGGAASGRKVVDIIVAVYLVLLQYCCVDEASSRTVGDELMKLRLALGPAVHKAQRSGSSTEQALVHLHRGAVALEFRLQYEKPVSDMQTMASLEGDLQSVQHQSRDRLELSATCVAIQRLAVLHDAARLQGEENGSAQIEECLTCIWRDIDEMVLVLTAEAERQHRPMWAKWEQIVSNIFLLALYTSNAVMEKFFACVMVLLSPHGCQQPSAGHNSAVAAANGLVSDPRFFEFRAFREVGLAVIAERLRKICARVHAQATEQSLVAEAVEVLANVADAETDWDRLDPILSQSTGALSKVSHFPPEHTESVESAMLGVIALMRLIHSVPPDFFAVDKLVQCVRITFAVELVCGVSTRAAQQQSALLERCVSALMESRRALGWSLATVCTGKRRSSPLLLRAQPVVDAACEHFLRYPAVLEGHGGAIDTFSEVISRCLQTIATDHSKHIDVASSAERLLPSIFAVPSTDRHARWRLAHLTAFLRGANAAAEAKPVSAYSVSSMPEGGDPPPLEIVPCASGCAAALARIIGRQSGSEFDLDEDTNPRALCVTLMAQATLLDARRIQTAAQSSVGTEATNDLGQGIATAVATCARLLDFPAGFDASDNLTESCLELIGSVARVQRLLVPRIPNREFGALLAVAFRAHAALTKTGSCVAESALKVVASVVHGATDQHMKLLLQTIASELAVPAERCELVRVWTAVEVLRVAEEAVRGGAGRHKRLMQQEAAELTQVVAEKLHSSHGHPGASGKLLQRVTHAMIRALARLIHYSASSGIRAARQTACVLQAVERASADACDEAWPVSLGCTQASMELIAEMARIRARDVLQCMPLFIACIRGALNAVWSLSARMKDAGQKLAWEGCAAKLCALYEMLPRSLSAGSLRRYVPYMLSDYIDAALRQGRAPSRRDAGAELSTGAVRGALLSGVYALLGACSPHELRQLHSVHGGPGRVVLDSLVEGFRADYRFKGN